MFFSTSRCESLIFRLREEATLSLLAPLLPDPAERDEGIAPLLALPLRRPLSVLLLTPFVAGFSFCERITSKEQKHETRINHMREPRG